VKGTWDDPAIVDDPRIDHLNLTVRAVAQQLHSNESLHLHNYVSSVICPYCALRTSRILRWAKQHDAGREMEHDTPFGLTVSEAKS
jgi:hypothetical protein